MQSIYDILILPTLTKRRINSKLHGLMQGNQKQMSFGHPRALKFVKIAHGDLNYKLKEKFEGIEFWDLFKLMSHATRLKKILKEVLE